MPSQSQSGGGGNDGIQGHTHLIGTNDGRSRQSLMGITPHTFALVSLEAPMCLE